MRAEVLEESAPSSKLDVFSLSLSLMLLLLFCDFLSLVIVFVVSTRPGFLVFVFLDDSPSP